MGRRIDYQLLLLWSMLALAEFDASLPGAAAGANAAVSRLMLPPCSAVGSVATLSRRFKRTDRKEMRRNLSQQKQRTTRVRHNHNHRPNLGVGGDVWVLG